MEATVDCTLLPILIQSFNVNYYYAMSDVEGMGREGTGEEEVGGEKG